MRGFRIIVQDLGPEVQPLTVLFQPSCLGAPTFHLLECLIVYPSNRGKREWHSRQQDADHKERKDANCSAIPFQIHQV